VGRCKFLKRERPVFQAVILYRVGELVQTPFDASREFLISKSIQIIRFTIEVFLKYERRIN
jgi:hypothetical protein